MVYSLLCKFDGHPEWFQKTMLSVYPCLYNPGSCSTRSPCRCISPKFRREGEHRSPSICREWSNKGFVWGHLRRQWQSLVLPKSQLPAFHRRTRFPFQQLPSQPCCTSTNDVWLKHIWLLSGEGKHTMVCLNAFIIKMNLENLHCQGFLLYRLAAAPEDWHYLACLSLVRRGTFHECAGISGMNSCTCTFTFWLLRMLFLCLPLWTLLFVSNSNNKIQSLIYTWKANRKEAGKGPNWSNLKCFSLFIYFALRMQLWLDSHKAEIMYPSQDF